MWHHPYVISHEIGKPLCSCYKTSKHLCLIAHMFFHTKSVIPCGIITKRRNPYVGTFYYKTSNPLSPNFYFTKIGNPYFQTIKTKDNNPKWLFETCKCYKRASFYYWKSVQDCWTLRYHQLKLFEGKEIKFCWAW